MFKKSLKVTIDRSGDAPKATLVEERNIVQGIGDAFNAVVDDNIAVSGIGLGLAMAGSVALSAYGTNRILTGKWNANPFSA